MCTCAGRHSWSQALRPCPHKACSADGTDKSTRCIPADGLPDEPSVSHTHILEPVNLSNPLGSAFSRDPQGLVSCSLPVPLTVAFPQPAGQ